MQLCVTAYDVPQTDTVVVGEEDDVDQRDSPGMVLDQEDPALDGARRIAAAERARCDAEAELKALVYAVSHDLGASLRAVDGFSRLLAERYRDSLPAEAQEFLDYVRAGSDALKLQTDALLEYSRLLRRELHREIVDPAAVAREAFADFEAALQGRQVRLTVEPLPHCRADRALLRRVYHHLLSNAVKFTRPRAIAQVTVGCLGGAAQALRDRHTYFVRDNGIGFDPQQAPRLFTLFQRLHRDGDFEGVGAGLALVRHLVSRHGGRVWIDSKPDHGTCVYFEI